MSILLRGLTAGLLLCPWLLEPIAAQEHPGQSRADPLGYGFAQAGILGLDLGDLNASLGAAGLPTLDESVPLWGGGGYGRVGRFQFGAEGHGGLDPTAVAGSRRISLKGGYGLVRAKYRLLSLGPSSLYPTVGVGAGGISLRLAELGAPTFQDVIDDSGRSSTLSTGLLFLLSTGVAVDYQFQVQGFDDGGGWGLVLGVEGGYMLSPGHTGWTLDDVNAVVGGPRLAIEGFYVWFSLGGWGRAGVAP